MSDLTLPEFLTLVAELDPPPISIHYVANGATGDVGWSIHVRTCEQFDRLAAALPTEPSQRWLNGDRQPTPSGPVHRYHAAGLDGAIDHICHGCEEADA